MPLTPETLTRHELAGLPVRVVADDDDRAGLAGRVRRETMRTLRIDTGSGVAVVPKEGATFRFVLEPPRIRATDEAAGGDPASGTRLERASDTAGVRPGQSGATRDGSRDAGRESATTADGPSASGDREGRVSVTVDGARLLSRPATRTERTGDTTWH